MKKNEIKKCLELDMPTKMQNLTQTLPVSSIQRQKNEANILADRCLLLHHIKTIWGAERVISKSSAVSGPALSRPWLRLLRTS